MGFYSADEVTECTDILVKANKSIHFLGAINVSPAISTVLYNSPESQVPTFSLSSRHFGAEKEGIIFLICILTPSLTHVHSRFPSSAFKGDFYTASEEMVKKKK